MSDVWYNMIIDGTTVSFIGLDFHAGLDILGQPLVDPIGNRFDLGSVCQIIFPILPDLCKELLAALYSNSLK